MNKAFAVAVGLLLLAALVLFSTTYTVRFNEVAVRTTFGKTSTASVQTRPGVHFRFPLFADRVSKYDTRIQLNETSLVEVPTADGQSVVVRCFLLWQMDAEPEKVLLFASSFPTSREADSALNNHLMTAVKASLGRYSFDDLIGPDSKLPAAEQDIHRQLQSVVASQGIRPVTVGISQVQLPAKITRAVLSRMQATRTKLAETERTSGQAEARRIRGNANTVVENLQAFAEQRVEQIKGGANRKAAEYLREMSQDEAFAIFLVQLDTLRASLKDTATLIFSDESAPWHLLNQENLAVSPTVQSVDGPVSSPTASRGP
jgi:membrane protease subunit HflC